MGLFSGRWFDQGYFKIEFFIGTILILLSYVDTRHMASELCSRYLHDSVFMLSICNPSQYYGLVLTQGLVMGIGCGLTTTPALCLQSHYWRKRRALSLGLVQAGSYPWMHFRGIILIYASQARPWAAW